LIQTGNLIKDLGFKYCVRSLISRLAGRALSTLVLTTTAFNQVSVSADDKTGLLTTLCTIVKNPRSFDGKRVRFAAEFVSDGMHASVLLDPRCELGITPHDSDKPQDQAELDALDNALGQGMAGTIDKRITAVFVGIFSYRPTMLKRQRVLLLERVMSLRVYPKRH